MSIGCHAQDYNYIQYNTKNGLQSNSIYGVLQDSDGYIWTYSEKGISRFDGQDFEAFTVQDGLPTNDIWGLQEDSDGRIWLLCYAKQAVYYQDGAFHSLDIEGAGTLEIIEWNDEIWIWTGDIDLFFIFKDGQLIKKNLSKINQYIEANYDNRHRFRHLRTYNEQFFIATPKHILTFGETPVPTQINDVSTPEVFTDLYDLKGRTYLHCIDDRFYSINIKGIVQIDYKNGEVDLNRMVFNKIGIPDKGQIQTLLMDNHFQLSLENGLYIMNTNLEVVDFFSVDFLRQKGISTNRKFKDRAGNIWVSTKGDGIIMIPKQYKNAQLYAPLSSSRKVTAIHKKNENTYFGNDLGELYKTEQNQAILLNTSFDELGAIRGIHALSAQQLIVVSDYNSGIFNTNTKEFTPFEPLFNITRSYTSSGLDGNKQVHFDEASQTLYAASFSYVYKIVFRDDTPVDFQIIARERTTDISLDGVGRLWSGHSDGLQCYENDELIELANKDSILNRKVSALTSQAHRVLVGTDGYGVYAFDGTRVQRISATKGDIVSDLFMSNDSTLWVATNTGIKTILLSKNDKSSLLHQTITVADGLPTNEINHIYIDKNEILAGTSQGLVQMNQAPILASTYQAPLLVHEVHISEQSYLPSAPIHLSHDENDISIDVHFLSFESIGKVTYEYQLNENQAWITTENLPIQLQNLPSGQYFIGLRAKDLYGHTTLLPYRIRCSIATPFWLQWWFWLLGFGLLMGLFYIIYSVRVQRIQQKATKKSAIAKRFAEMEMQALQAQMNPHFIFNCLGSIQNFVLNNDMHKAVDYLGKFGYLMRLFLESSKNKLVPLSDEINLLRLYLELEQMRFSDKFEGEVLMQNDIYAEDILVPSMLIQPFLENAIKHAFYDSKAQKDNWIKVAFTQADNSMLLCTISDNGIGRKNAALHKAKSIHTHKSRGIQIVNERLEVFQHTNQLNIQIKTTDLTPDEAFPGTKVTIEIPLG